MKNYDKYQSLDQQNRVNSGIAHNKNTDKVLESIFSECTEKVQIENVLKKSKQTKANLLNVNFFDDSFYGSEQQLNYSKKGRGKYSRKHYHIIQFDQIFGYTNEINKTRVLFTIDNTKSDHGRIKGKFADAAMLRLHFGEIWYLNFEKIFPNANEYKYLVIPIVNLPSHLSPKEYKKIARDIAANIKLIRECLDGVSKYCENGLGISFVTDTDALAYFVARCYGERICDEDKMREILYEYYTHPMYHMLPVITLDSIGDDKAREVILWYLDNEKRDVLKEDLVNFIKEYNGKFSANIKIKLITSKKKLIEMVKGIIHSLYREE